MQPRQTKFSIVTPSYNQGHYLEQTIDSVLSQKCRDFEYMIIDGGSSDNSVEVIKKYSRHLSYWIAEKDSGQAHAISKGLYRASGEWFNWINSDDLLAPDALSILSAIAAQSQNLIAIAGSTQNFSDNRMLKVRTTEDFTPQSLISQPLGSAARFHQPSIWLKTEATRKVGINTNLHYRFDLDLYIRYLLANSGVVSYTNDILALFRFHDSSKTCTQSEKFRLEYIAMLEALSQSHPDSTITTLCLKSKMALEWIGILEFIERAPGTRIKKISRIFSEAQNFPIAFKVPRTWRAIKRILVYGGR